MFLTENSGQFPADLCERRRTSPRAGAGYGSEAVDEAPAAPAAAEEEVPQDEQREHCQDPEDPADPIHVPVPFPSGLTGAARPTASDQRVASARKAALPASESHFFGPIALPAILPSGPIRNTVGVATTL